MADSILELFQRRHSSDFAMEEWKKIEAILPLNCFKQLKESNEHSNPLSYQGRNTENHKYCIADDLMVAMVASDDMSMATNMVENKLITSEFEQNMLKEEELKCKNELPPVQTFQKLNAERIQRHRLNKRLWSLRRQSSEFESSLYNSSSCGSASSDPSNGSSSSNSTSRLGNNVGISSALSAALSSAMLTVSAPVSKTPEKPVDATYTDLMYRLENESGISSAALQARKVPSFRKSNTKIGMLKNHRSITTVIEEVSSG